MVKFQANSCELGISGYAKQIPMYLNRQLISLLSARRISDTVFINLMRQMTETAESALRDNESAKCLIKSHCNIDDDRTAYDQNEETDLHLLTHPMSRAWYMLNIGISPQVPN